MERRMVSPLMGWPMEFLRWVKLKEYPQTARLRAIQTACPQMEMLMASPRLATLTAYLLKVSR